MFDKSAFIAWWKAANLSGIGLTTLSIDAAKVNVEAAGSSTRTWYCNGLKLGDKTAHLTITANHGGDFFEYFHLTLDQPEVQHKDNVQVRCDHVFFETDEVGDVCVVQKLCDSQGKEGKATSKRGLSHNQKFLVDKVLSDVDSIMGRAAYVLMPENWKTQE